MAFLPYRLSSPSCRCSSRTLIVSSDEIFWHFFDRYRLVRPGTEWETTPLTATKLTVNIKVSMPELDTMTSPSTVRSSGQFVWPRLSARWRRHRCNRVFLTEYCCATMTVPIDRYRRQSQISATRWFVSALLKRNEPVYNKCDVHEAMIDSVVSSAANLSSVDVDQIYIMWTFLEANLMMILFDHLVISVNIEKLMVVLLVMERQRWRFQLCVLN